MQSEISVQQIISKFKRNGHNLTKSGLTQVIGILRQAPHAQRALDTIIKQINDVTFASQNYTFDKALRFALQLIKQGDSRFKTFDDVIDEMRKSAIYYISPYEDSFQALFCKTPRKQLFEFQPNDKMEQNTQLFRKIEEHNKKIEKGNEVFIGVLYESFQFASSSRPQTFLQNQVSQVQIVFPPNYKHTCFAIPGCTYVAKGNYLSRDLVLTLTELKLPQPASPLKESLLRDKFKKICEEINASKDGFQFSPSDFKVYETIFDRKSQSKPVLIFGNVTLNASTLMRIDKICEKICSAYLCQHISSLIFMLSEQPQEAVNVAAWLPQHQVFIVPHINSEGPRLLPKIPILRNDYKVKVLTNPARFSLDGREVVLVNYPIMRQLHSKQIFQHEVDRVDEALIAKKCTELIFSQGNVAVGFEIFPKQSRYFDISSETIVVMSDQTSPMFFQKINGKEGGLANSGNFSRDGDFICYSSKQKNPIQFCQEPTR